MPTLAELEKFQPPIYDNGFVWPQLNRLSMSSAISMPVGDKTKTVGLSGWMERVPEQARRVREDWDTEAVHDLRVALRRCRTMADVLREVYPDPGWRRIRKSTGDLFHLLGELRDTQVKRGWVKRLSNAGDPSRKHMLRLLGAEEKAHRAATAEALDKFDRKGWKKIARRVDSKAQFFPLESVVFQRQALTRLNEAVQLHQKARKRASSAAWHRLRIGIKQFRYIVENFLPQRYEVWAEDLKKMQDLLGDVHDLDVLRAQVRRQSASFDASLVARWIGRIDEQRKARLDEFRALTANGKSPWIVWRAGFRWGHALNVASLPQPVPIRPAVRYAS